MTARRVAAVAAALLVTAAPPAGAQSVGRLFTSVEQRANLDELRDQAHFERPEREPEQVTKAIHRAIKGVTRDLDELGLNTAIAKLMEAINDLSGQPLTRESAEKFVLLLAPLAPHLAEELWQRMGHTGTLAYEQWPTWDEQMLTEDAVTVIIQVLGKKRGQVEAPRDADDDTLQNLVIDAQRGSNFEVDGDDRFIVVRDKKDQSPKLVNVIAKR